MDRFWDLANDCPCLEGERYRTDIINERTSRTFNTYLGKKLKIA